MSATHDTDFCASSLLTAARAFHDSASETGSSTHAPAVLTRLEEALQLMSAGWYQLAADAAPGIGQRRRWRRSNTPPPRSDGRLSREQEVHLAATLHDLAAAFAGCARACRTARPTVTALIDKSSAEARSADQAPSAETLQPLVGRA
jgi:hypothetical protein